MTSNQRQWDRRKFCRDSIAAIALGTSVFQAKAPGQSIVRQEDASKLIAGKDSRLIVLKKAPAVFETPLELLTDELTPTELLFVRNNQQPKAMESTKPVDDKNWRVDLTGLLNRNASVTLEMLRAMPQLSVDMVLQCSGNGRALYSKTAQTKGTQWGRGGFGCVRFGGVPVSNLLESLGVEPFQNAAFVKAEGKDGPVDGAEDFLHSLPIDDFLNRSMLAIEMNGKPIPAIHGGPVRLVTPGVYATMNLKWLGHLTFEKKESTNYNHLPRYRVPKKRIKPGTDFQFTLGNSSFNWNMKTKSIVLKPSDQSECKTGRQAVEGLAFNDGGCKISSVLVSSDQGASWKKAKLSHPQSKYAWTRFRAEVTIRSGNQEIWTRAIDERGRSQPLDGSITWNPRGYEWNGVEKVVVVGKD